MNGDEFRNQVGGVTRSVEKDGKEKYRVNNKQAFKKIIQNLKILARATPEDKFMLIAGL
jgi:Ca2+ transporting ATPase